MSSSRHSCYHSWINPLAVLAVLLLVAMTTLQIISPVNATIEGQEESLGHPEMMGASPFAECKRLCENRFTGSFVGGHSLEKETIVCTGKIRGDRICELWCDYCTAEYGEKFDSRRDVKFRGIWALHHNMCACSISR
eukprot:Nk52_evm1s975 gene=Nk52_evmTU1s975